MHLKLRRKFLTAAASDVILRQFSEARRCVKVRRLLRKTAALCVKMRQHCSNEGTCGPENGMRIKGATRKSRNYEREFQFLEITLA